ncbi:MAG: DUF523 and DUF1722 domain-containing protein [Gammaproteobacteria bacterium]|nr:DUF523 and DUF1722 domain-containing protein [Gammaproteobacteria bacterium]MYH85884.1 DUF523 and DUF1722 domain-containing protein [Gammaproteobacteria bacterium]MYK04621.1 DUF523 and DUF1722 domain-containing protein [Gammaproteobacteria bacterium]
MEPDVSQKEDASGAKIPVGVSSCLLGDQVRYDGGHKRHSYITGTLGKYFEFRPFCPEVEIGLGIPRKPIRLVRAERGEIRCVQIDDPSIDHTRALRESVGRRRDRVAGLCGYILKKDSPSCGMERVRVWRGDTPARDGSGIFADALMREFPWLPVEEEGRLGDSVLRENFIQRVFVLRRWFALLEAGLSAASLTRFHARHKLIVMSHDQTQYLALGRLLADAGKSDLEQVAGEYLRGLMAVLKITATRGRHVNVLQHIMGYLKKNLAADDRQELVRTIEDYRLGLVPLIVPITLLNHFFRKHPHPYIAESWYMKPYPAELILRNQL